MVSGEILGQKKALFLGLLTIPWLVVWQGEKAEFQFMPAEAAALASNEIRDTPGGFELINPAHHVAFTGEGIAFTPRGSTRPWRWSLERIGTPSSSLLAAKFQRPRRLAPNMVGYERGSVVEQYLAHAGSVEQRFVLEGPLTLSGEDLVIEGHVESEGDFVPTKSGWTWEMGETQVHLGDVTVVDAKGRTLPARMDVGPVHTRIFVEAMALADAFYPVTIDPEIGANDFRISDIGPDGDLSFHVDSANVAYNSRDNEYLAVWRVWERTDDFLTVLQVFGQRLDAATGQEIGANDFHIRDNMAEIGIGHPAVAYNTTDNEYLVVWNSEGYRGSTPAAEEGIFGQRITAGGKPIGAASFQISSGPSGENNSQIGSPKLAYNSKDNEYLVAWRASSDGSGLAEDVIFGQRLSAKGKGVGRKGFRIGDTDHGGPDIAYNSKDNEFLVVWDQAGAASGADMVGQRLDAATGKEVGRNGFAISNMPRDRANVRPQVAYNSTDNQYLAVWGVCVRGQYVACSGDEMMYAQRLSATGVELGANDFQISDIPPTDVLDIGSAITYNSSGNEYLVVWSGEDNVGGDDVIAQRIDGATGLEVGRNDFLIDETEADGSRAGVAYNPTNNEYLVVWKSDHLEALAEEETEAVGQRLQPTAEDLLSGRTVVHTQGKGQADLTIRRGRDYLIDSSNNGGKAETTLAYGRHMDTILLGDMNGDGRHELIIRRGRKYLIDAANDGGNPELTIKFGKATDDLLVADLDGDGRDNLILRRGAQYLMDTRNNGGKPEQRLKFGKSSDAVFVADLDGNGTDELVIRQGNRFLADTGNDGGKAELELQYGRETDVVFVADLDGNGTDDLVIRRGRQYRADTANDGGAPERAFNYMGAKDTVLTGDMDGNGTDDLVGRRGKKYRIDTGNDGGKAERVLKFGRSRDTLVLK